MKAHIPIHKLHERSRQGLEMIAFDAVDVKHQKTLGVHRDDHYIFILQQEGAAKLMLDFKTISIKDCCILYIKPGQVHHSLISEGSCGWFMAIDTHLVPEEYRMILEHDIPDQEALNLNTEQGKEIISLLKLLYDRYLHPKDTFYKPILYALVSSYIGLITEAYQQKSLHVARQNSRPVQLTRQFRSLLLTHFKTVKAPSDYAGMLNISLTYLNEVVKSVTGFPVSYWIHHELILEAKRLLYYTDLGLKEIAAELGFSDHTYFSRLFSKTADISAGKFRQLYR